MLLLQDIFLSFFTFHTHHKVFSVKGLHFLHLNARSLLPKIDEIRLPAWKVQVQ